MSEITRRRFGAGLGALSIGAFSGAPAPALALALAAASPSIPKTPMRLARRIIRGLGDGNSITVTREWRVGFANQGRGIALTGVQISAKVDAPAKLAAIAQIEERRSTEAMWPILLSDSGRIVAAGEDTNGSDVAAAVREAERLIASRNETVSARARHKHYLAQMQQASAALIDKLPPDLFFPKGKDERIVRAVDLPEGLKGEFVVAYSANSAPDSEWLSKATRRISTRIGNDVRESREEWEMAELLAS